jgi:hypothetical protein
MSNCTNVMKIRKKINLLFVFALVSIKLFSQAVEAPPAPKISVTLGTGYAFQYYNNLRQAGESGTPVRLDLYSTSTPIALRLQVNYAVNATEEIRLLISPFSQSGSFIPTENVRSKDAEFISGEKIDTRFSFDVYRLGFANKVTHGFFKDFKIGATLIIRKWETNLKSATKNSYDVNWLGLPLLYLGYEKNLSSKLFVTTDLDIIAAPFAYALEGGTALNYKINQSLQAGLQYRILSGAFSDSSIKNAFTTQNIGVALTTRF